MSLSKLITGLNALDNTLNGIEKQLVTVFDKLGISMDGRNMKEEDVDVMSKLDSIHETLMLNVRFADWLVSQVHKLGQTIEPDEPEVEGAKRDYNTIKPM